MDLLYAPPPPMTIEHGKNSLSPCFTLMNNNPKKRFDFKGV